MNYLIKAVALLLIVAGIPTMILDSSQGAELPLLTGLFLLLISKEKKEDERSIMIKWSSTYIALLIGYGIKLIATNLYSHHLISHHLIDINHFLIVVFAMAILIAYSRIYILLK